nr:uncharacterized protein FAM120A2P isoform X1 [Pongo abelii]
MVWDAESEGRAEERGAERSAGATGGKGVGKAVFSNEAGAGRGEPGRGSHALWWGRAACRLKPRGRSSGSPGVPANSRSLPAPLAAPSALAAERRRIRSSEARAASRLPSVARGRRLRRGGGGDRGTSLAQPGARAGPSPTLLWPLTPGSPAPPDPHAATFSPAQRRRGRSLLPSIFQPPIPENQFWDVTEQADIILEPASLGHCSHHTTWQPDPVRLECLGWCRRMFLLRCSTFRRPLCKQSPWPHRCPAQGAPRARVHTRTASLSQHLSLWTRAGRI